jgi:hypothetical protein
LISTNYAKIEKLIFKIFNRRILHKIQSMEFSEKDDDIDMDFEKDLLNDKDDDEDLLNDKDDDK